MMHIYKKTDNLSGGNVSRRFTRLANVWLEIDSQVQQCLYHECLIYCCSPNK